MLLSLANNSLANTLSFNATVGNVTRLVSVSVTNIDASSLNSNSSTLNNATLVLLSQLVDQINNGSFTLAVPPLPPPLPPSPSPPFIASSSPQSSNTATIAIGAGVGGGAAILIIAAVAFFAVRRRKPNPILIDKTLSNSLDKAEGGKLWKLTAEQETNGEYLS